MQKSLEEKDAEQSMELDDLLTGNLIASHLDRAGIEQVSSLATPRQYAAGERIAYYGDLWPYLFILESGSITALKESADGRALAVVTIEAGEVF